MKRASSCEKKSLGRLARCQLTENKNNKKNMEIIKHFLKITSRITLKEAVSVKTNKVESNKARFACRVEADIQRRSNKLISLTRSLYMSLYQLILMRLQKL